MNGTAQWLLCVGVAYLLGSIPFGLLIGLARGVDVRRAGSNNIGATNVGRVLGRRWGILCFVLDFLKGLVPVLGAGWWLGYLRRAEAGVNESWMWLGVAAAALLGHVFPLYLRFKGGKGVATGFGAMVGVWPLMTAGAVIAAVVWLVVVKASRMVSVASCAAACALPVVIAALCALGFPRGITWEGAAPFLLTAGLLCILVVFKHRANLARVRAGTERKIGAPPSMAATRRGAGVKDGTP